MTEDEDFKPDWMNYQEGFAAGVLEGREQIKQALAAPVQEPDSEHRAMIQRGVDRTTPPVGDIRALKHRIHELEGELLGYKKIVANQDAMLERQTARIVDLQTHIENFEGEE